MSMTNKQLTNSGQSLDLISSKKISQDCFDQKNSPSDKDAIKTFEAIRSIEGQHHKEGLQDKKTDEQTDKQTHKQAHKKVGKEADEQFGKQIDKAEEQAAKKVDEQVDEQADKNAKKKPEQEEEEKKEGPKIVPSAKLEEDLFEVLTDKDISEEDIALLEENLFKKYIILLDESKQKAFLKKLKKFDYVLTNTTQKVIKKLCPHVDFSKSSLLERIFIIYTLHQEKLKQIRTREDYPIFRKGSWSVDPHPLYISSGGPGYVMRYNYFGKASKQIGNCYFIPEDAKNIKPIEYDKDKDVLSLLKDREFDFKVLVAVEIVRRKTSYETEKDMYFAVPVVIAAIIFAKIFEKQTDEEKKEEFFKSYWQKEGKYHIFTGEKVESRLQNFKNLLKEYLSFFKISSLKSLKSTLEVQAYEFFNEIQTSTVTSMQWASQAQTSKGF